MFMHPSRHISIVGLMLLVVCGAGNSVLADDSTVGGRKRLNVLMIAVDDLRPELACYGAKHIHSPNIDALASRGLRFNLAYCQVAVCGASRASLLSGCRPETTNCWDYKTPMRSRLPEVLSLPQHFKQNGYQTAFLGKVYHSKTDDPQGWSLSADELVPANRGLGKAYAKPHKQQSKPKQGSKLKGSSKLKAGPSIENGGEVADNAYVDGHNAERAVKLLGKLSKEETPFFLAVGFIKPHLPFVAPGKYWDLYDRDSIQIPSKEDVIDGVSYARSSWGELKNYPDIPRDQDPLSDEKSRELIHGYYAAVSYMDAQVGKLLKALDDTGLAENTVVILWGDHGWYLGDFGDWCKHTNYEVATRVPLIVHVPGMKEGAVTNGLTEYVDIYPTLCELTGLEIPEHCQGSSFAPLLEEPEREWKQAAFSQYKKKKPRSAVMLGTSVRTQRYRYTEWREVESGRLDALELIDFDKDPNALRNVAAGPEYASEIERLSELAKKSAQGVAPK